eukprot:1159139-Pelagomonas_calceolata.AAC.3
MQCVDVFDRWHQMISEKPRKQCTGSVCSTDGIKLGAGTSNSWHQHVQVKATSQGRQFKGTSALVCTQQRASSQGSVQMPADCRSRRKGAAVCWARTHSQHETAIHAACTPCIDCVCTCTTSACTAPALCDQYECACKKCKTMPAQPQCACTSFV